MQPPPVAPTTSDHSDTASQQDKPNNQTPVRPNRRRRRRRHQASPALVWLLAWLFINGDPAYCQSVLRGMMLSRALLLPGQLLRGHARHQNQNQNLNQADSVLDKLSSNRNGLSTVEAVALIQAINSNNNNNRHSGPGEQLINYRDQAASPNQHQLASRQLPVPVPVPVPVPRPPTGPVAVLVALLAALVAAVSGFPPFAALVAAIFAALVALLAIIVAPFPQKAAPIVKKLVIKKTVLPFVIPIPYKAKGYNKGGEEKAKKVYVYVKKKHHHEHEHQRQLDGAPDEELEHKSDEQQLGDDGGDPDDDANNQRPLVAIERVLGEQERLQAMSEMLMDRRQAPEQTQDTDNNNNRAR